jgi:hypothetical protein
VFKGNYFSDTDFWNAPKPRSTTFTLRSILYDRELRVQGVQRGIRDGRSVKILSDYWVSRFPLGSLKPKYLIPVLATVHCLMDEETSSWNIENIYPFFEGPMAEQILHVPISRLNQVTFHVGPTQDMACTLFVQLTLLHARLNSFKLKVARCAT